MKPLIPTLSLQVTYQCNIECKHCGPYCGPHEKDWMTEEEIRDLIMQASELGAFNVVFTGGEPSLLGRKLPGLLRFIKAETAIHFTRIVTNGKWATTPERAMATLTEWRDAGLDELNVSCGEYHQEFVPIANVANAYRAGRELGFRTVLLAGEFLAEGKGKLRPEDFDEAVGEPLMRFDVMSPFIDERQGLSVGAAMCSGRGEHMISRDDVVHVPYEQVGNRCAEVLKAITAHPNGNLTACCGVMVREESLLTIGNWRTTRLRPMLEAADQDLVLNWIRYVGLKDMKQWLLSKDPTLPLRSSYTNICDLCQDVMYNHRCQDLIVKHAEERAADILANRLLVEVGDPYDAEFKYAPRSRESEPPGGPAIYEAGLK